jgi:hypothetical protein
VLRIPPETPRSRALPATIELLGALVEAAVVACEDSTEVAEFFEVFDDCWELADEF